MKTPSLVMATVYAVGLAAAFSVRAETVALWTFEDAAASALPGTWTSSTPSPAVGTTPPGAPFASDVALFGTGGATAYHANDLTYWLRSAGNGSARSFNSDHWGIGDYYQFSFTPAPGYTWSGITLEWDQNRSASGPTTFYLDYSTDGSTFNRFDATDYSIVNVTWSSGTYNSANHQVRDLSGLSDLNSALDAGNTVYFRVVNNMTPSSTGGTCRIDNFMIAAPVPEPSAIALFGIGLLLFGSRLRRAR